MAIKEAERFKQWAFPMSEIEAVWDKQVWFWKRKEICRLYIDCADLSKGDAIETFDVAKQALKDAKGSLLGFGFDQSKGRLKIAFRTKADAMLFKLAHS